MFQNQVRRNGGGHRTPGEGHSDARTQLDPFGGLGREQKVEERVVARLGRPHAVVTRGFGVAR